MLVSVLRFIFLFHYIFEAVVLCFHIQFLISFYIYNFNFLKVFSCFAIISYILSYCFMFSDLISNVNILYCCRRCYVMFLEQVSYYLTHNYSFCFQNWVPIDFNPLWIKFLFIFWNHFVLVNIQPHLALFYYTIFES